MKFQHVVLRRKNADPVHSSAQQKKNAGLKITFKGIPSEDISKTGNEKSHNHVNTTEASSDTLYNICHIWI